MHFCKSAWSSNLPPPPLFASLSDMSHNNIEYTHATTCKTNYWINNNDSESAFRVQSAPDHHWGVCFDCCFQRTYLYRKKSEAKIPMRALVIPIYFASRSTSAKFYYCWKTARRFPRLIILHWLSWWMRARLVASGARSPRSFWCALAS